MSACVSVVFSGLRGVHNAIVVRVAPGLKHIADACGESLISIVVVQRGVCNGNNIVCRRCDDEYWRRTRGDAAQIVRMETNGGVATVFRN